MIPLYEDSCFTFRFAEARIIPRFHLEGVETGRQVKVFITVVFSLIGLACIVAILWTAPMLVINSLTG